MSIEEEIKGIAGSIQLPEVSRSLAALNLVRDVTKTNGEVKVTLASTGLNEEIQSWLKKKLALSINGMAGVSQVTVDFVVTKPGDLNRVKNTVAIMSGKGGVGKSLVTGLLAVAFRRHGKDVGILDADITGPSIPHMFGIKKRPMASETGVYPVPSTSGINIMSINLMLPHVDDVVRWRGPVISGTIRQFWDQVVWGNLDLLLVDLPPGTSDAPLTVIQALPLSGAIIVTTPQSLVGMVVRKAINLSHKMNVTIHGIVENMSYLVSENGQHIEVFGKGKAEELAAMAKTTLLARIPLDPALARVCDEGHVEDYQSDLIDQLGKGLSLSLSQRG